MTKNKKLLASASALAAAAGLFLGTASSASASTAYHHLMVKTNGDTQSILVQGTMASTGYDGNYCINKQYWGFTPWVNGWVDGKITLSDYTRVTVTAYSGANCDRYQYNSKTNTVPGPDGLTNFWDDLT